jgi:hypothetical protein
MSRRRQPNAMRAAFLLPTVIGLFALSGAAQSPSVIEVGQFSRSAPGSTLPADWQPLTFKKVRAHTAYNLVQHSGTVVVEAVANASASGMVRRLRVDPKAYPILEWRWNIANILHRSDLRRKSGDDYPARIYVTFDSDPSQASIADKMARALYGADLPHAGLNYIWDSKAAVGTVVSSAYTDRLKMIVVESGSDKLNQWLSERRNIYQDYKTAFGEEPPSLSSVAIMTDTDDTGESARALYGDIRLVGRDR